MTRWLRRVALLALAALVAAVVLAHERLARLHAFTTLFDENRIVENFSTMDRLFETVPIPVTRTATALPVGTPMTPPAGWDDWLARRAVTGIVVLHDGAVVHETYRLGTGADDQRISWSLAKSYLSMLIGVVLAEGAIRDLDDPVTDYAPRLAGSAYDGASIRDVLQMASGVDFDEDYLDFWSDINRMGRVLALGRSMDGFAANLEARTGPPGERWTYVSIDTHVLSMVLRGATGEDIPTLLGRHILDPLGAHGRPYYLADGHGTAFVLGGLNLTTRDYARMGELARLNGRFDGRRIVPDDWMAESTAASAPTAPGEIGYGYQWWVPEGPGGEVLARGVYGQFVYIDRNSGVVVAVNGADRRFRDPGAFEDALAMFRAIAAQQAQETGQ